MSQLKEILTRYVAEHPIDFGMSEATAVLEVLCTAYCESRESAPPETKSLFAQLSKERLSIRWIALVGFGIGNIQEVQDRLSIAGAEINGMIHQIFCQDLFKLLHLASSV